MEKLDCYVVSDSEDLLVGDLIKKPGCSVTSNEAYREALLQRSLVVM